MKKSGAQKFVVVDGLTVVGSVLTLRDALAFRTRKASRSARILTDRGTFDPVRRTRAARHDVCTGQLLED